MKGQFFILGAIAFSLLFLGAFSARELSVGAPSDLGRLSGNLQGEYPVALNLLLNDSRSVGDLMDFVRFADSVLTGKAVQFRTLWVATEGTTLSDMSLYAGNYMGVPVLLEINVDGDVHALEVQHDSANNTVFPGVQPEFNITISFGGTEKSMTMRRDKANLYAFVSLGRNQDLAVREVIG